MEKPTGSLISYFSKLAKSTNGINLAQGKPGFSPPDELLNILEKKIYSEKYLHQYPPGIGDSLLIQLISDLYSKKIDNILILQGATEGLSLSFFYLNSILKEKYSVLSFDPPYESYPKLAELYEVPFEYFDFEEDLSIDFDKLENLIEQKNVKIIFIASPGNPLGRIWEENELEKIDKLSKKLNFYIIFDAVYKDIYFNLPYSSPMQFNNENLFFVDSFSKMLSITGWRIGYLIAHENHMKKIRTIHDYIGLCAPYLFQRAIADYLQNFNFGEKYTISIRNKCNQTCSYLKQSLTQLDFEIPTIQGGYFLWAELPFGFSDGFQFALHLHQKANVAVVPGENFSPNKKKFIRLNFATNLDILEKAVEQISIFFDNLNLPLRHRDTKKTFVSS